MPHPRLTHAPPTPQLPYHIKVTGKATKTDLPGTTIWHCQFASFECPSKLKLLTKRDQLGAIRYVVIATGHHEHDTPGVTHETRQIKIRDTIRKVVVDNWRPKTILNKRSVFDSGRSLGPDREACHDPRTALRRPCNPTAAWRRVYIIPIVTSTVSTCLNSEGSRLQGAFTWTVFSWFMVCT